MPGLGVVAIVPLIKGRSAHCSDFAESGQHRNNAAGTRVETPNPN